MKGEKQDEGGTGEGECVGSAADRENENMYQGPEKKGKEKSNGEWKGRSGRLRGREGGQF